MHRLEKTDGKGMDLNKLQGTQPTRGKHKISNILGGSGNLDLDIRISS
jgi:hypothetical protein